MSRTDYATELLATGFTLNEANTINRALAIIEKRAPTLDRDSLSSPAAVRSYLRLRIAPLDYEAFYCVWLDAQNRAVAFEEMFRGTLTQTSVYPREVVKRALRHNAAGVILAHNHPSGVAEPSFQDQNLTRVLKESLALVDVKVLDHFIVAGAGTTVLSFAERGLL